MYSDMVNLSNYLSDFRISQVLVQTVNSTPVCLTHTHKNSRWNCFGRYLNFLYESVFRSSRLEVFIGKGVPKICSKFTGKHSCRIVILIKLLCSFIEITLRLGYSPVKLLHIFKTSFPKNTCGGVLLRIFLLNSSILILKNRLNLSTVEEPI